MKRICGQNEPGFLQCVVGVIFYRGIRFHPHRPLICSSLQLACLDTMSSKPAPPWRSRSCLYTSLWDFKAMTETELSFRAGDLFQVIEKKGEWWWAKKLDPSRTGYEEGYVPYNYLAKKETMEAEP